MNVDEMRDRSAAYFIKAHMAALGRPYEDTIVDRFYLRALLRNPDLVHTTLSMSRQEEALLRALRDALDETLRN